MKSKLTKVFQLLVFGCLLPVLAGCSTTPKPEAADSETGETPTYAYWRPTRLVSDNRIPALATDETTYVFALPAEGEFRLDVRLSLRRAFIDLMDAKGWDTPDRLMAEYRENPA